jgi:PAS domain S-box-containing protein
MAGSAQANTMAEADIATVGKADCAREPIHIPGAIQPHGYLVILDAVDHAVIAVSQNLAETLDLSVSDMIGRTVGDFLQSTTAESLDALLARRERDTPIRVMLRRADRSEDLDGVLRINDDVVLLELEASTSAERARNLFGEVRTGIERIRHSPSFEGACQALVNEVRRLSGFDRVMVYRFDEDWNGQVVAEDRLAGMPSYLGHAFPASDIPAQARALYLLNTVRIIPDARYRPSPIVPALDPSSGRPFDLSDVTLRSVSPVHLEYLANMGVAASMSVSIVRDNRLWGLVACHHASPRILPQSVLQSCDLLAHAAAWYLDSNERAAAALSLAAVRRLEPDFEKGEHRDVRDRLASVGDALLATARSDGLAILEPDAVWATGVTPSAHQLRALANWLSATGQDRVATDRLSRVHPPAAKFTSLASGMVASRLGAGWLVWFRTEWPHSLTWAGRPDQAHQRDAETGRINPRKSFEAWRQKVHGRSAPWTMADLAAVDEVQAIVLRAKVSDVEEISAFKAQQEALRTSEETFRQAMQLAVIGKGLADLDGRWINVNDALCDLLGYDEETLLANDILSITHPDDRHLAESLSEQVLTGDRKFYRIEKRLIHSRGHAIPVELGATLIRNSDGSPKYLVIEVLDLTAAKEIDRVKSEFMSTVSHELRTPLTAIRGSLGLLLSAFSTQLPPTVNELIAIAHDNSDRLILLINDMLDLDKMAAGQMRLDMSNHDLGELTEQAIVANRAYAATFNIGLVLEAVDAPVDVLLDPARYIQILSNLISNAVKFSRDGREVEVRIKSEGAAARISVTDHGHGIADEFRNRIFGKFAQEDGSASRARGGTGLGLHITRQLVEQMGGAIGFDTRLGQGTTFWVEFPIAVRKPAPENPDAELIDSVFDNRSLPEILYVEDDRDLVNFVRVALEGKANLVVANTLRSARARLRKKRYDLILLDILLPDGLGLSLFEGKDRGLISAPVVILAAEPPPVVTHPEVVSIMVKSRISEIEIIKRVLSLLKDPHNAGDDEAVT